MVIKILHPTHNFSEYPLDILWNDYYPVYSFNSHHFEILPPREFIRELSDYFSGEKEPSELLNDYQILYNFILYQRYDFILRGDSLVTIHELVYKARPSEHGMWSKIKISPNIGLVIQTLDEFIYDNFYS